MLVETAPTPAGDIGSAIRAARGDMSQEALAGAMRDRGHRWSQTTVWSIEKGHRSLQATELLAVASALGVDLRTLLPTPTEAWEEPAPPDVNAAFGEFVQVRRTVLGWSQKRLADELYAATAIPLDASGVSRIEQGSRRCFLDQAVALCRVLGGADDIPNLLFGEHPTPWVVAS